MEGGSHGSHSNHSNAPLIDAEVSNTNDFGSIVDLDSVAVPAVSAVTTEAEATVNQYRSNTPEHTDL